MTSLPEDPVRKIFRRLSAANHDFMRRQPGESGRRQPVHTVYGGAHLFKADIASRLGALARRALEEYAPTPGDLAAAIGLRADLAPLIHARVSEKLQREPVEDFRADFEDGYGSRPNAEEDGHAASVAREMAAGLAAGTLPAFVGIRIKPFTEELTERSYRTLCIFLKTLIRETGGRLPDNFVVTLPKVTIPEQVATLVDLFNGLEPELGLAAGSLRMEVMIETPQLIVDLGGGSGLSMLTAAAQGRCVAAHFGTYDYTAACNITAEHQSMTHPVCDFAKHMMQVAYAGTGLWLSDGATNVLPVPPHRAPKDGPPLNPAQIEENRAVVHRAWSLHAGHVQHSLTGGFYQGWDLHPAQLVTRYAALYSFFLEGLDAASDRLHNFVQKAAQATLVGEVFDDAATGQGLLNYFLRAVNCGAITEEEALERSGLTLEELRGRSFVKILKNRRG
ncbi:MAG TPA: phosphoenolpyruvate kinase [Thermoanaerobaculia bacterium]|jgi:citrate lyase beta subunit|nr:phosphoenolpyruvate kinase [Thermoanaerobaculia bacterium]